MEYSRTYWIQSALESIVNPDELQLANPGYQTDIALAHLVMTRFVAGEFYRLEFDSKCKIGKMPPCRTDDMKRQKQLVIACAELWVSTFRVLERMQTTGRWIGTFSHIKQATSFIWLRDLVADGEFLTPWARYIDPDGAQGIKELLKQYQKENGELQNVGSPFDNPFEKHNTRLFIASARATADESDRFCQKLYNPMVRRRKAIAALIKKQDFVAIVDGERSRQGRKKMPISLLSED